MGYSTFKEKGKAPITSDQIGPGQVKLEHFAPELFVEIRNISLHSHTGVKSRKINMKDLDGGFGIGGFFIYSSDGTKRYRITVDSATDAFVLTQV